MKRPLNTDEFRLFRQLILLVSIVLAGALLLLALSASSCNRDPGFGDPLMQKAGVPHSAEDYKYVADSRRQLYWPNTAKYINRIPKANRVWILDDATLAQFRGYHPGER